MITFIWKMKVETWNPVITFSCSQFILNDCHQLTLSNYFKLLWHHFIVMARRRMEAFITFMCLLINIEPDTVISSFVIYLDKVFINIIVTLIINILVKFHFLFIIIVIIIFCIIFSYFFLESMTFSVTLLF